MTRRQTAAALIPALVLASGLIVMARGKFVTVPVVATIADSAGGAWLRVASDTQGAYVTTSQVTSTIQTQAGGSDYLLTTYYTKRGSYTPSSRGVRFDLSEYVTGSGVLPAPISLATMPAHLKVGCSNAVPGVDMLSMTLNQTANCPGSFRFWAPNGASYGDWYRLGFNNTNYAEVDPLKVTCTSVASGGCKTWTITPSNSRTTTDTNPKNLARLIKIDQDGNVLDDTSFGNYYVSFNITVVR